MNATKIPRLGFESLTITNARTELAKDAKTKLGYNKLALAIACPDALLFTLRELDINPLSTQRVQEYKQTKESYGMWSGKKWFLGGTILAVFSLVAVTYGLSFTHGNANVEWSPLHYAANTLFAVCSLIGIWMMFWYCPQQDSGNRTVRKWESTRLTHYQGNVPEFVLSKAVQIHDRLPLATFGVEYLVKTTEHKSHPVPLPDPFLYARLGDECYYIDVWDEKEYENHM